MSTSTILSNKKYFSKKQPAVSAAKSKDAQHKENTTTKQLKSYQDMADQYVENTSQESIQLKSNENKTGLPNQIKQGVESLSGHSLDDVRVHYNSDKPAQLKAHAYAEGSQIHVAKGQEKHLAHEAWHVVQQKENRVSPTTQVNGIQVNDNNSLEHEADLMGAKASSSIDDQSSSVQLKSVTTPGKGIIQGNFEDGETKKEEPEADSKKDNEEKAPIDAGKVAKEVGQLGIDGLRISSIVQTLDDPGKEPVTASGKLMEWMKGASEKASKGVLSAIASIIVPLKQIASGVSVGYQKWNAWGNIKKLGEKQGDEKDPNIPYTIKKLSKAFLSSVNTVAQGIINLIKNIMLLIPEALSKVAAAGLATYGAVVKGLTKLYTVPKRWYQLYKGDSNQKDIRSTDVCNKAFNEQDENSIDFIWALDLPSIKGSGFDSIDYLKQQAEKGKNKASNYVKGKVNKTFGSELSMEDEDPQSIALVIKEGTAGGKTKFTELCKSEKGLTEGSKAKIQAEVKSAMTGFGT